MGGKANFKLSAAGEKISLLNASDAEVDSVTYPAQTAELSWGRIPDGTGEWKALSTITPGSTNKDSGVTKEGEVNDGGSNTEMPPDSIVMDKKKIDSPLRLNELLADSAKKDDWVELYNPSDKDIDLENYQLKDSGATWKFPAKTMIKAKSFLQVVCDGSNTGGKTNFKLSSKGESVALIDPQGNEIDSVTFPAQTKDVSWGRIPDGNGKWKALNTPTPSAANKDNTSDPELVSPEKESFTPDAGPMEAVPEPIADNFTPKEQVPEKAPKNPIVLNEVMAVNEMTQADPDYQAFSDWVELYNTSSSKFDLSNCYLSDDPKKPMMWKFPKNTVMMGHSFLLVWADKQH